MAETLNCWKCGAALPDANIARSDECASCRAQLHVCRLCRFYDPKVSQACREPVADPVNDKERANFCGYFEPSAQAYRPAVDSTASRQQLEALFDGAVGSKSTGDDGRAALERLFGGSRSNPSGSDPAGSGPSGSNQ